METRGKKDAGVNDWRGMCSQHRDHTKPVKTPPRFSLYHGLVGAALLVGLVVLVTHALPLVRAYIQ